MSDYIFQTGADQEAAVKRFGARAAAKAAKSMPGIAAKPATEVYDECRDHAYDMLLLAGGEQLVDLLLGDVTDEAVGKLL